MCLILQSSTNIKIPFHPTDTEFLLVLLKLWLFLCSLAQHLPQVPMAKVPTLADICPKKVKVNVTVIAGDADESPSIRQNFGNKILQPTRPPLSSARVVIIIASQKSCLWFMIPKRFAAKNYLKSKFLLISESFY